VFAEHYSLSISELEQNLHDCRQLPFTWTLLEVVTKVLTTLSLVCFSATNPEPLNRPRISLHEEEEHLVITPNPSKTALNRNRQLLKEVTRTLKKNPATELKNDRRKTPITNPNSRRKTHSKKNPNDRKTLVAKPNQQQYQTSRPLLLSTNFDPSNQDQKPDRHSPHSTFLSPLPDLNNPNRQP